MDLFKISIIKMLLGTEKQLFKRKIIQNKRRKFKLIYIKFGMDIVHMFKSINYSYKNEIKNQKLKNKMNMINYMTLMDLWSQLKQDQSKKNKKYQMKNKLIMKELDKKEKLKRNSK